MKNKLPNGWQEVELGKIMKLRGGFAFKSEKFSEKGIPIIRISNFNNNDVDLSDSVFCPNTEANNYNEFLLKENDILIAMSGATTGKIGVVKKEILPCLLNQRVGKFEILDDNLYWKYLLFFVKSSEFLKEILSMAGGCAQPNISGKQIESIKIILPSLPVQKKIVAILEKAESLKQKREEADKKTNEYLKSVFYEMFYNKGFEEVELGEVCEINPKKSELEKIDKNLEVSFVPMAIVKEHESSFIPEETKKLNEVYKGYTYFKNNDVLLAKVTPCFENGKSGIAKKLKNGIGFGSSEYHVIRPSQKLLGELVYFIISDNSFLISGKKQMSGTGGLKRLPKEYITNKKIPLPPLSLQQKFAKIVEHVEKLKEKQKQSKEEINNLFDSLMKKAFNGELVK